jgi:hypothetical protein
MLSGAFLTSSINSGPEIITIHLRKVATLNKPGLVYKWEHDHHQFYAMQGEYDLGEGELLSRSPP